MLALIPNLVVAANKIRISTQYFPYYEVAPDIDEFELNGGILFDHNLKKGNGFGFKISHVASDSSGHSMMSIEYNRGRQHEVGNREIVNSHAMYLTLGMEYSSKVRQLVKPYLGINVGVGGVRFDFKNNVTDEWGGALKGELLLGARFNERLNIGVGGGIFTWGYPTETIGRGVYLTSEIGLTF